MNLAAYIMYLLGIAAEIIWLWEAAHKSPTVRQINIKAPGLSKAQLILGCLVIAAFVVVGLFYLLMVAEQHTDINDWYVSILFMPLMLFVLGAGVVTDHLLPRINEKSILNVQVLIILGFLTSNTELEPTIILFTLVIPAGFTLFLVIQNKVLSAPLKAVVYFWYLTSLLILSIQTNILAVFSLPDLSLLDGFTAGVVTVFLLLHVLFLVRFFLIVSSMLLPRNRQLLDFMMPRLFADQQIPLFHFVLITASLASLVGINAWLHLLSPQILITICIVFSTQFLFQPR